MMTDNHIANPSNTAQVRAGKYLTFFLGGEEYGLQILTVHEIIGMMPVTRVPRTPHFMRGVINLRGKVIPIVNLRAKFGMDPVDDSPETCIVVVQLRNVQVGLLVDQVSEVIDIAESDVENAPEFGSDLDTDFILGIAKSNGRVKLLLNIDHVLSLHETKELTGTTAAGVAA
jgi:purine-binding chemotaxis protein CheW